MASDFDAVSLDVGGVLVVPDHGILASALSAAGLSFDRARFGPAHYHGMAAIDRAASEPEFFGDYLWGFVRAVGVPTEQQSDAHGALDGALIPGVFCQPVPGSRVGLRSLADAGLALAVTSNSDGGVADLLRRHEWAQVGGGPGVPVVTITDSGIVGFGKPDPHIFQTTIDALGVAPERVLHIGDSVHYDVDGALAMGMQAVHMDPFDLCNDTTHRHVAHLGALLG